MSDAPPQLHIVDRALDDTERAALVFDGALVVQRGLPAMRELVRLARGIVVEHFGDDAPALAQARMDRVGFLAAAAAAQAFFGGAASIERVFATALAEAGLDAAAAGWDRRVLRVLPSGDTHAGGRHAVAHVHRDTWGSSLYAQVNWWAPVLPVEAGSTIVFYPGYWHRPLANSSDTWSWEACRASRRVVDGVVRNEYPTAPVPLAGVGASDALPVVLEPGDLLSFSAAHLHGGTDNTSGRIRFSIETRTLSLHDLRAGRAAPNVDGHGVTPRLRWFRQVLDGTRLDKLVSTPATPPARGRVGNR